MNTSLPRRFKASARHHMWAGANSTTSLVRVLITGVTGMIGSNVAAVLLARVPLGGVDLPAVQLYGMARFRSDMRMFQALVPQENVVTILRGDLDDPASVSNVVAQSKPHIVFHFGAQAYNGVSWSAPSLTMQTNIIGTLNLLEALRAADLTTTRVLMAASSAQYGAGIALLKDPTAPFPETTEQKPLSPYGVSKAAMELLGRQYGANFGMPIMYARLFPQCGLGQSEELAIQSFTKQVAMVEKGLLPHVQVGNLQTLRDYSDVEESAVGLAHLAFRGIPNEAYNFASGRAHRMQEILDMAINIAKRPIPVRTDPARMRASDEALLLGNASKVWTLLGWKPRHDLHRSVRRILKYWRTQVADEHRDKSINTGEKQ